MTTRRCAWCGGPMPEVAFPAGTCTAVCAAKEQARRAARAEHDHAVRCAATITGAREWGSE